MWRQWPCVGGSLAEPAPTAAAQAKGSVSWPVSDTYLGDRLLVSVPGWKLACVTSGNRVWVWIQGEHDQYVHTVRSEVIMVRVLHNFSNFGQYTLCYLSIA